jgi:trimethylamine--corrinoid protein Co-methyltransferase
VGPGGSFIDQEHTAAHWRKELWRPELLDRDYYQAWLDKGRLSMEDRCRERKRHILSTHTPEPISDELAKALDGIVQAAQLELGAK